MHGIILAVYDIVAWHETRAVPTSRAKPYPIAWRPRNWHPERTIIWPWSMKERNRRGSANRATLAVARKMVAYLLAVDRGQRDFVPFADSERGGIEPRPSGRKTTGSRSAQNCQVLRLPTERRTANSRGSLRIVSGLAEYTHSIFCDGPQGSETVNGCPVLRRQELSPRGTSASCGFCKFHSARSSVARVRRLFSP